MTDRTRHVSLTEAISAFIQYRIASGRYQNGSAAVRAGLRLASDQDLGNFVAAGCREDEYRS